MDASDKIVCRYTILASALDILQSNHLVLLSPAKWSDQNDRKFLEAYQARKHAKSVVALCLTSAAETSHHWTAFAKGTDGVRIELDREKLEAAAVTAGVLCKDVEYKLISEISRFAADTDRLPFLERYPYENEREVRLVFADQSNVRESYALPLGSGCIQRIVLSPELPAALENTVRRTIQAVNGCENLPVHQTTLHSNDEWIRSLERVVPP